MPMAPGAATVMVVERIEDATHLDRKGQPTVTFVPTPVAGCKIAPHVVYEQRGQAADYASGLWDIATPPHPAAVALQPDGLLWYDDGGALTGRTQRATYDDPDLGPRDVAQFTVTGSLVLTDLANQVDHVTIVAKSEVG